MARYEIVSSAFLASPASVLGTPAFDPYPGLIISVRIPGYSLAILPLLQFNGDTGSTSYSFSVSDNLAIASTGVSGTATGLQMCQTSGLALAEWIADIQNPAGAEHGITWKGCGGLLASVAPISIVGTGIWTNTAQITTAQINSGAQTMNAGTRIAVIGISP